MSSNWSTRTKMMVKLAVENKLAVVSEELSVISVTDTLREAGFEIDSPESYKQIHPLFVNSDHHSEDDFDFNALHNQDSTPEMDKQQRNVLPNNNKDYISLSTSQNLQSRTRPPENITDYTVSMPSEIDETISHNSRGGNLPNTCKKSCSDFSDFEYSGSEYCPSIESVIMSASEDCQNYQVGKRLKTYSRKNILETAMQNEKSAPLTIYAASQPSTSEFTFMESEKSVPSPALAASQPSSNKVAVTKPKTSVRLHTLAASQPSNSKVLFMETKKSVPLPTYVAGQPSTSKEIHKKYLRKPSARERPTICPFCFDDVFTHFPRHLFRHHSDREEVKKIEELSPKNKERIALIKALRKQGYFHLKVEKNVNNPVRNSRNPNTNYAICEYCLGDYSKTLLYKHVKQCKSKPADVSKPGKNCLSNSQTFMASIRMKNDTLIRSLRIRDEVFKSMMADEISLTAKSDVLICLYGETLMAKHKREQISTLISSKMREMARMLIALRSINPTISNLFDSLKPDLFSSFVLAAKNISGYDSKQKNFRAPSLALHMGTNLKIVCCVAYKVLLERKELPTITWENFDTKRQEIKDLKKLIEGHWCNEISSLALKTLKERNWERPTELPLAGDILLFQNHIYEQAEKAYEKLNHDMNQPYQYKILTECILAHTIMFNRKRVGDVQYLTIETYTKEIRNTEQEAFVQSLTEVEKILSQQFKRVVTGGKGSKPVAILFSKKMQKYIKCLLQIRKMGILVPKSNPYLFANPGSEKKWMVGVKVISKLAKNCGAERPTLLSSTKFRKHIATTLQLLTMQPEEMEQLASFMGHTKKTHAEFYRLPQDIYQTAKVAKVLLLLEKGKGKSFQGKTINEIQLEKDIYYSSNSSEDEEEDEGNVVVKKLCKRNINTNILNRMEVSSKEQSETELYLSEEEQEDKMRKTVSAKEGKENQSYGTDENDIEPKLASRPNAMEKKKLNKNYDPVLNKVMGRIRWKEEEKNIVNKYFAKHIQGKVTPKKHECDQFLVKYGKELQNKDWVKVKTLVYNTFRGN